MASENRYNGTVRPALIVALALVPACSFDLGFDGTRYQCGAGDRCPAGQSCVGGVCTAENPDAAIDPDGAVPARVCGNLSLLRDDFGAGAGARWYPFNDTGAMVAEANGALVIDLPAGVDVYAGYQSAYVYDLHGGRMIVQVDEVSAVNTILEIRNLAGENAQLVQDRGDIYAALFDVPGGGGTLAKRIWNPTERFWQIREDGGDMVWELSSDRQTWSELHRAALPFDVAHVRGTVSAGGPTVAATRARFADVNLDGTTDRFCPVGDFRDDFAAAPFAPAWDSYTGPGCTIAEQGGDLVMTFTGTGGNSFCGLNSHHLWDLTQGAMVVDGSPFPSQPSFVSYVQAASPATGDTRVEFIVDGTTFEVRSYVAGASQGARTATVDRVVHKFWRIRAADAATAVFDTSRDGVAWVEFERISVPWDLTAIEVSIGAGNYGATNPVTIRLPGLNAP